LFVIDKQKKYCTIFSFAISFPDLSQIHARRIDIHLLQNGSVFFNFYEDEQPWSFTTSRYRVFSLYKSYKIYP